MDDGHNLGITIINLATVFSKNQIDFNLYLYFVKEDNIVIFYGGAHTLKLVS